MMPLGQIAIDIYMPSLPAMAAYFHTGNGTIQHLLTFYLIGLALSLFFCGPLADRFGRFRFVLLGLVLYLSAALLTAIIPNLAWMFLYRFIQGIGAGLTITAIRASVTDTFEGAHLNRVVTNMTIVWGLGPILAPVLGGYLEQYIGWRANFLFMFFYGVLVLILAIIFLGETHKEENRQSIHYRRIIKNFATVLREPKFLGAILALIMNYCVIIIINVTAPFLLQKQLGLSAVAYGQTIFLTGLSYLSGTLINKKLQLLIQPKFIALYGIILSFIAVIVMLVLSLTGIFAVSAIIVPACFAFLGIGFSYPNCLLLCMELFKNIAGSVSALIGSLPLAGIAAISAIAALLPEKTALPLSITCSVLMTIGLLSYLLSGALKSK